MWLLDVNRISVSNPFLLIKIVVNSEKITSGNIWATLSHSADDDSAQETSWYLCLITVMGRIHIVCLLTNTVGSWHYPPYSGCVVKKRSGTSVTSLKSSLNEFEIIWGYENDPLSVLNRTVFLTTEKLRTYVTYTLKAAGHVCFLLNCWVKN